MLELEKQPVINYDKRLKSEVAKTLLKIGMPVNVLGFTYLKDILYIIIRENRTLKGITTYLYPKIAEAHNTTPEAVERTIRNCIEKMYKSGLEWLSDFFEGRYFDKKEILTNSAFIGLLAEKIRANLNLY